MNKTQQPFMHFSSIFPYFNLLITYCSILVKICEKQVDFFQGKGFPHIPKGL